MSEGEGGGKEDPPSRDGGQAPLGAQGLREDGNHEHVLMSDDYSAEFASVEAFLDENADFFQNYLIRKATRSMIDAWLVSHSIPPGSTSLPPFSPLTEDTVHNSAPSSKSGSSGGATPVRKVSAHEFEKGGLTKPLVTTIDGTPTFLSPPTSASELTGQIRKKSRTDMLTLNETELILELVKDIYNDLDVRSLCHKILQNVGILTYADRCSLFLVGGDPGTDYQYLVSNLFDVSSHSTVEEVSKNEIKIPWGSGIVGFVAKTGQSCNVTDCYKDSRFNQEVDVMTGYRTKSMMCSPIKDTVGDVIGVAQVINKANEGYFNKNDEMLFEKYLQFCGIGLRNAQIYERSQLEVKRNQVLLDLAGVIFQEQSTLETTIHRILTHMLSLIQCERAMVLLVHEGSQSTFSQVFDMSQEDLESEGRGEPSKNAFESRFPMNAGITGYVAATGEIVNIPDAYLDKRFDKSVDENTGFRHSTLLAMPIKHAGSPGKVLGVFQLVNKFDHLPFTSNDENFVEAFAIFCGMGINNVKMYETAVLALAKQQVTLEVLSYHAISPLEEAVKLSRQKIPSASALHLQSFQFDDFSLEPPDTLKASLRMFIDLDLINRFNIDYLTLCRWLSSVRKNYRDVTYHNWQHAFNVCQLMFAIISNTMWWKKLGETECLALVLACLCHDLDHRGTNNSYQIKSSNSLAQLYSTSTMEHHHFDQCLMILNTKGNMILANLSQEEFKAVIRVLEESILATDLALYFKRRKETSVLLKQGVNWQDEHDRSLFRGLMMTACDLGAITKPWPIQQKIAQLVSSEFFFQGDLEKTELHLEPIPMMDRGKQEKLPSMQVNFIDEICLPVYESLASASSHLSPLLQGCKENRTHWSRLADQGNTAQEEQGEKEEQEEQKDATTEIKKESKLENVDK